MTGTYYETDRLSSLLFVLAICALLYLALLWDKKKAEKKGLDYRCMACKNRSGNRPTRNCKNCTHKFHN